MRTPIAVICSDLHLSHKPPVFRSKEPDWYAAQARMLKQIDDYALENDVPVLCAGDIFDYWSPPASLLNMVMETMAAVWYAIPGQHDLPHHNYEDIQKSGYWTLVSAGRIKNLDPGKPTTLRGTNVRVWAFPWGYDAPVFTARRSDMVEIAVVHAYIWKGAYSYPGAPEAAQVATWRNKFDILDAAIFGDNHRGFIDRVLGRCTIYNHGTQMIRKADEALYQPTIGVLYDDGSVGVRKVDISEDVYFAVHATYEADVNKGNRRLQKFIEELDNLGDTRLDFLEAVDVYIRQNDLSQEAELVLRQSIEHGNHD